MRVLVAVASTKRGTRFLAESLGDQLSGRGLDVDVRDVSALGSIEGYDAVIVGASLRRGRWRRDARQFVLSHSGPLSDRPVWLFATRRSRRDKAGTGDVDLGKVIKAIGVHEHRVFDVPTDRLLRRYMRMKRGAAEKVSARPVWEQVSDWAQSIVDTLVIQRALMSGGGPAAYAAAQVGELLPPTD